MRRASSLVLAAVAVGGCSAKLDPAAVISVGGTYQTAVTLVSSTCLDQIVEQHPTVVTQTPGSSQVALTHAGSTYTGTLSANGAFTTPALTQVIGGVSYAVSITGQFGLTTIEAQVRVDAARQPPCTFTARWAGLKDGAPNVIP